MGLVTRAIGRAAKPLLLRAYGEWHYGRWLHFTRLVPRLPCDLSRADILDAGCGARDRQRALRSSSSSE